MRTFPAASFPRCARPGRPVSLARAATLAVALPLALAGSALAQTITGEWRVAGTQEGRAIAAQLEVVPASDGGLTVRRAFRFAGYEPAYAWTGRGVYYGGALRVLFTALRGQAPAGPSSTPPASSPSSSGSGLRIYAYYALSADGARLNGVWQVDGNGARWGRDTAERPAGRSVVSFTDFLSTPFVQVEVNGSPRTMLFDTGANTTAVDANAAREIGLVSTGTSTVAGTTGTLAVQNARVDRLRLGQASASNVNVTLQNLSGFLAPNGGREEGLLGTDFIGRFLVTLNYARGTLALESQAPGMQGLWLPPLGAGSRSVPMPVVNGLPRLRLRLDDSLDCDFTIDSGLGYEETDQAFLSITQDMWDRLRLRSPALAPERYFTVLGMGGWVQLPVARIRRAAIGGFVVDRPWVVVQPRAGTFAAPDAPGLVGNNFLRKLGEVRLDFRGRRLEFRP
ncbi:MAG: clan AA aspartic protease [Planctomycetes bacterium]|nr:clan AA aspartic protease [Planctomycetota bacterium]